MALLLPPMSAIPHIQCHMTSPHGPTVPSPAVSGNKRPKLSLQTSSLPNTYGSLTRGLVPDITQTIYTPTTVNTLSNTWDLTLRPSPISRTESPRPSAQARLQPGSQPYTYILPFGLRPILKNSPLPPRAASVSASPRESRRKVFFPQPKRVTFKHNLEEPIDTKQFLAKHSDLTSSEEETSDRDLQEEPSSLENNDNAGVDAVSMATYHTSPPPNRKRKIRRDSGIYVDAQAEASSLSTPAASTTDDVATIKPALPHKRRKWRLPSSSRKCIEKNEGSALKNSSRLVESETESELVEAHDEQPTQDDDGEDENGDDCHVASILQSVVSLSDQEDPANPVAGTARDTSTSSLGEHEGIS